jgi:hypothetical protein
MLQISVLPLPGALEQLHQPLVIRFRGENVSIRHKPPMVQVASVLTVRGPRLT